MKIMNHQDGTTTRIMYGEEIKKEYKKQIAKDKQWIDGFIAGTQVQTPDPEEQFAIKFQEKHGDKTDEEFREWLEK